MGSNGLETMIKFSETTLSKTFTAQKPPIPESLFLQAITYQLSSQSIIPTSTFLCLVFSEHTQTIDLQPLEMSLTRLGPLILIKSGERPSRLPLETLI